MIFGLYKMLTTNYDFTNYIYKQDSVLDSLKGWYVMKTNQ